MLFRGERGFELGFGCKYIVVAAVARFLRESLVTNKFTKQILKWMLHVALNLAQIYTHAHVARHMVHTCLHVQCSLRLAFTCCLIEYLYDFLLHAVFSLSYSLS